MLRSIALLILAAAQAFGACASGTIQITDTLLNPDSTAWNGTIVYTLAYSTTTPGGTVPSGQQYVNIVGGAVSLCLAPGLYVPVTTHQSGQQFPVTTSWGVPVSGGPYTVAQIQGNITLQGSFGSVALTGTPTSGQVPTATSGTAATWQAPAGAVLMAKTTLTHAQVLTLHSVPVTFVAAPGSGFALLPLSIVVNQTGSPTYQVGDQNFNFTVGTGNQVAQLSVFAGDSGLTTFLDSITLGGNVFTGNSEGATYANQPLIGSTTLNPTGAGGSIIVTVYYMVVPLN